MNKWVAGLLLAAVVFVGWGPAGQWHEAFRGDSTPGLEAPAEQARVLGDAFAEKKSGLQVTGEGVASQLLPDDNRGSRHQRFVLTLASGQTVLVAHNIDLAPRLDGLRKGDTVAFRGVYEWNPKGGVVHWTHLDPQGNHLAGWLEHRGKVYQ